MLQMNILLIIALAPLLGAIVAGPVRPADRPRGAHTVTIGAVAISCLLSIDVLRRLWTGEADPFNQNVYTFFQVGSLSAHVGFLIDRLTAMMMVVVSFVSLLVHVYTIGYMKDDPGYQRFFSYISLFTFSMLMLVMSNNFLQLFFGWEAVGLVSYLLIGFWYTRPSAIFANLKAFLVNRVGDFGFLLGIAGVLFWFQSLDYATVFQNAARRPACCADRARRSSARLRRLGSAGAQLHLHLPVHRRHGQVGAGAAARVAARFHGRPDPDLGADPRRHHGHRGHLHGRAHVAAVRAVDTALAFVLFIGATTAFFTGLIGMVQNDIKRVVAYSTLSQLGYMTVALGVSAYSAAVFHLMTHAFFKALLFLGAGSVIIAMHHEQDMRRMGGLRKYMPITFARCGSARWR
jgi:NADH-quinone oxidoreductase subunit L